MKRYVFSMTGASGTVLGIRVLRELVKGSEVHLLVSSPCLGILKEEAGLDWSGRSEAETTEKVRNDLGAESIRYWDEKNFSAPVSSGSYRTDGMLVVPCSMKTLAGIAGGYAGTLTERAADVAIKEGRPLLVSPREMPFSAIHLRNMLRLAELGVKVAPPVPAFYSRPRGLDDMVDFLAGKILDAMGVENSLYRRWEGRGGPMI